MTNANLVNRIVKLFKLGEAGKNNSEMEVLAAITKAKEMMARYNITDQEIQEALNKASVAQKSPSFDITSHTAYTRKIRSLAVYDENVAVAVGYLTNTHPILWRTATISGMYTSMRFIGTDRDAQVASALFMILLQTVRKRTRDEYGGGKNQWSKQHTSYAVGFSARLADRAHQLVGALSSKEQQTMALVVQGKEEAIERYKREKGIKEGKKRKFSIDSRAYIKGTIDANDVVLDKVGIQ